MESVRRVYPSDVAPVGFLDRDPDPATAFTPVDANRVDGSIKLAEPPSETAVAPKPVLPGPEAEPPEPPPIIRPAVAYPDSPAGLRVRYPLLYPVKYTIDGEERVLTELTAHPPALWDIQDWAAGRLKTNYELMARMLDTDPVELGALRWPDIATLIEITTSMLPQELRDAIALSKQINEPNSPSE